MTALSATRAQIDRAIERLRAGDMRALTDLARALDAIEKAQNAQTIPPEDIPDLMRQVETLHRHLHAAREGVSRARHRLAAAKRGTVGLGYTAAGARIFGTPQASSGPSNYA